MFPSGYGRCVLLALVVVLSCFMRPLHVVRAQSDQVLDRQSDERVVTTQDRQQTITILLAAADEARAGGDHSRSARYLNRAGRLQLTLNLPNEALTTFQTALDLINDGAGFYAEWVSGLNGMGASYVHLARCEAALKYLDRAVALSEARSFAAGKAEALLTRSDCQRYENHELALRTAQEALALWQSVNDPVGIAEAQTAIGQFYLSLNRLPEATESLRIALDLWRRQELPNQEAKALIYLGFVEYRKGAWANTIDLLTEAQSLLNEDSEPYRMGQITGTIAETMIESGMPEAALPMFQRSLYYFERTNRPNSVLVIRWGIGKTYYFLGSYDQALAQLQRTLTDALTIREFVLAARCHDYLGRTHFAMGDLDSAESSYRSALVLYQNANDRMEVARTNALLGQVLQARGEIEPARQQYQLALNTFEALTDQVNRSVTLFAFGELELKQGRLEQADKFLRLAIEVTENLRRVSQSADLTTAFSASTYERYEKYIECLMHRSAAGSGQDLAVRAFEISEQSRGRALADFLRATGADLTAGLDPELSERESSLRQQLRVKADQQVQLLGRSSYEKADLDTLKTEQIRLEAEYRQVNDAIRQKNPSFGEITQPVGLSLKEIQERVIADDETLLLEYSLGEDRSYVWAVTRDEFASYELPRSEQIRQAAKRAYDILSKGPGKIGTVELDSSRDELSRMILLPVAAHLNKRRIIAVADGPLNYIPFQSLPKPLTDGAPMVNAHEIVNASSASVIEALRRESPDRVAKGKLLAAFGDPVFASNYSQSPNLAAGDQQAALHKIEAGQWRGALRDIELNGEEFDPSVIQPLFYARRELANLRSLAGNREILIAAEFSANREQLLQTDLSQYAILHFATHGFLDPKRPENSGLLLSTVDREGKTRNGFVGLQDIYSLRAPVDLVVLSACRTGLGKDVRGEGLIGLTRGFMYAGASTVVSSLWKVDDQATAELMKQFYSHMLNDGMTPSEALRAAQNNIRQHSQWRSPYYWAAFTIQGEYRLPIRQASRIETAGLLRRLALALGVLTILAGLAWWIRLRTQLD